MKHYDDLLAKILALPIVVENLKELAADTEWNTEYYWGQKQWEESAIENFFEGTLEDVLAVAEIWERVKNEVIGTAEDITSNVKSFIDESYRLDADGISEKVLEDEEKELYNVIQRKYAKPTS